MWAHSVPTNILVFGNPNQTVIAFLLVIWWVMQPYFLAWMLTWELQVFPSWQKLSGFWKQVTMKLKKKKLVDIVNRNYFQHSEEISMTVKRRGNCSPVEMVDVTARDIMQNTKRIHLWTKKLAKLQLDLWFKFLFIQVDNSNQMGKKGFIKTLHMFKGENITPMKITTNSHTQIWKYMREKEPGINHQCDVWHFNKKDNEKGNKCKSEGMW